MIDLKTHQFSEYTVIVSRVKRVIENPAKISPVSCTMVVVEDTYYDVEGNYTFYETIAGSRVYATKVLKGNAGVSIDLSKLRPKGTIGSNGLVAQGVTNFMPIYSWINLEIRRGNTFKNGAVVLALDFCHPDLKDFLAVTKSELPWAKKSVTIDHRFWLAEFAAERELVYAALSRGEIFVCKKQYDSDNERLYNNVCLAVQLKSRSTCNLAPVNLGMIRRPEDIPTAMVEVYKDLDVIWQYFNATAADHFLAPTADKQIGLGFVGLANMLAAFGVSYTSFVRELQRHRLVQIAYDPVARRIAKGFYDGYLEVTKLATAAGYKRVFAIEPTASCSYANVDYRGYTLCPEISPPVCHPETKVTRREAQEGFTEYQYPIDVQVAGVDVDWDVYDLLCSEFQYAMNSTGLAHGISYNWWLTKPVNADTFLDWFLSPLQNVYYRWRVSSFAQDKTSIGDQLEGAEEFWEDEAEDEEVVIGNDVIACECGT